VRALRRFARWRFPFPPTPRGHVDGIRGSRPSRPRRVGPAPDWQRPGQPVVGHCPAAPLPERYYCPQNW
jgi:hypothetical protein